MKKIEVLEWGLQHIAANYKMGASTEDLQSEAEGCIYVTEEHPDVSPAPVNDVQMLCDDLGIHRAYMTIRPIVCTPLLVYVSCLENTRKISVGDTNGRVGLTVFK